MRKAIKILFRILGAILLFILLAVIAIPLLFEDQIIETVRRNVDQRIEGEFQFEKADVGILRTFPNLCLSLTKPVLTGAKHPDGDSLFKAGSVDIIVDILSVLKKDRPVRVVGLELEAPSVSIYTDEKGTNYDLVSDTAATTESGADSLIVEIDAYEIRGGTLRYKDRTADTEILLRDLDHAGNLRYQGDLLEIRSSTDNGVITLYYDGVAYLNTIQISGQNDIDVDLARSFYTLIENHFTLNALAVDADGTIGLTETTTDFNLTFSADRSDFKHLISLLPNMYTQDFGKIDASGNLALSGSLRGSLSDNQVPVYEVSLKVDNGAFRYPGKPLGFKDVALDGTLQNQSRDWTPVEIDITTLHFLLNNQPFDINALIRNPTGAGTYRGKMKGVLNLADFMQAYPLPDVSELSGIVHADVRFDIASNKAAADQQIEGNLMLRDIHATTSDQQFSLTSGTVDFDPGTIRCLTENASLNGDPVKLDMTLQNTVGWLTQDNQELQVDARLEMAKLDVNPYLTAETSATVDSAQAQDQSLSLVRFDADVSIDSFIYDTYVIENGRASMNGTLNRLNVSSVQGRIRGTSFAANGTFTDIDRYLEGDAPLTGKLDCRMDKVYVDRWIEADSVAADGSAVATEYVALPDDIRLDMTFRADAAYYDKIDIQAPRGTLVLYDRMLEIQDFRGDAFGGNVGFSGIYNTQDIARPAFNMKYDMSALKFSEAFREIETFQELAPIVRFVEGIFNSTLVMEGRLGEGYMPDFGTLSASGFIETLSGKLDQAQILDKLSQFLNLKQPLNLDLGKTRNWFEVSEGYVIMQELTKTVDDIELAIGGRHQIKGEMDYLIKLNIPAEKISSNPVGALAKAGYEELQKKASAFGVKLQTIDRFIVHVNAQGTLSDPKFSIKLFDVSGKSLKDVAEEQLDNIREQVKDTVTSLAEQKLQQAKDSLKGRVDQAVDSAKILAEQKLKEAGKDMMSQATGKLDSVVRDSLLNTAGDKAQDVLGEKAGKEVDKIKDALDKWDPFKKKKKD